MSELHALPDTDPLNPSDVDRIYAEGFADGWTSTKPRSLSAPLVLGLIAGAFLAGFIVHAALAASRPAPVIPAVRVETAGREPDRGRTEAPRTASAGSRTGASPSPAAVVFRPPATPRPKPPKVTGATVRGSATWYDDHRKSGLYAAVHSWRWGDTPYRVTVRAGDRSVVVTVSDFCLCTGGGDRVIDLSNEAFSRLAPLSAGVVDVTVRGLR